MPANCDGPERPSARPAACIQFHTQIREPAALLFPRKPTEPEAPSLKNSANSTPIDGVLVLDHDMACSHCLESLVHVVDDSK
ncbi:hypothetical protein ACFXTO_035750 [Malus domestica]